MPELPEVETIRRQLEPVVVGRTIQTVEITDARWCEPVDSETFANSISNREVLAFQRRGKYMVVRFEDSALVMHLRMTGNLLYAGCDQQLPSKHRRGLLQLSDGGRLAFVDPRRFGTALMIDGEAALDEYFDRRLGPEPFDPGFTPDLLHMRSRNRRTPVKAFLLDQATVAGIGNIYADEALFRAGIDPRKKAAQLTKANCEQLHIAIRDALSAGIDAKGASIDDFRDAYGVQGSFQDQFLVHRREGLPCPQCDSTVIKIRLAGRGTYLCQKCQSLRHGRGEEN